MARAIFTGSSAPRWRRLHQDGGRAGAPWPPRASEAVATRAASTIDGNRYLLEDYPEVVGIRIPRPEPNGRGQRMTAWQSICSSFLQMTGSSIAVGQDDEAVIQQDPARLEQALVVGEERVSSPMTSTFTKSDPVASRASRAASPRSSRRSSPPCGQHRIFFPYRNAPRTLEESSSRSHAAHGDGRRSSPVPRSPRCIAHHGETRIIARTHQ